MVFECKLCSVCIRDRIDCIYFIKRKVVSVCIHTKFDICNRDVSDLTIQSAWILFSNNWCGLFVESLIEISIKLVPNCDLNGNIGFGSYCCYIWGQKGNDQRFKGRWFDVGEILKHLQTITERSHVPFTFKWNLNHRFEFDNTFFSSKLVTK